jgi:hypothetical protein
MKRIPMRRLARLWAPRETCDTLPEDWIHEECQVFLEEHTDAHRLHRFIPLCCYANASSEI